MALWTKTPVKVVKIIYKNEQVQKCSYGHIANEEKFIQENLQKLTKNCKSLWHLNHDLLPPFTIPSSAWDQGHSRWLRPRTQGSFPPVRRLQHPLRRVSMPIFLILTPATCCQGDVPGKCGQEIGHCLPPSPYSGEALPCVWGTENTRTPPVLALACNAKYLMLRWARQDGWDCHLLSPYHGASTS